MRDTHLLAWYSTAHDYTYAQCQAKCPPAERIHLYVHLRQWNDKTAWTFSASSTVATSACNIHGCKERSSLHHLLLLASELCLQIVCGKRGQRSAKRMPWNYRNSQLSQPREAQASQAGTKCVLPWTIDGAQACWGNIHAGMWQQVCKVSCGRFSTCLSTRRAVSDPPDAEPAIHAPAQAHAACRIAQT